MRYVLHIYHALKTAVAYSGVIAHFDSDHVSK